MYLLYDNINNYTIKDYNKCKVNLNKNDKIKYNKLVKNNNRKLLLLSRMLLYRILEDKYNINYNDMDVHYNRYGKPFIDNIYFNISHSYDYAVVCTSNKRIGIDIEKIREVNLNTINYFCTDKEKEYIINSGDKYKSLFELFCLKEAYFKMLGSNLSDIKNIEFIINNNTIRCTQDENINIEIKYDIDNYIIAIIEEK
ncbi:MAG: 4'-phosphopantetheinyl transferase superfamily protein [Bacilli bacterium]|nr:4'-phosphopantetheinyl transferase superfamily protein [Bacilli bacterium]